MTVRGRRNRPMLVLGLMSGTSADGIDVALVQIEGAPPKISAQLRGFAAIPYPARVREAILSLADGLAATSGEISKLDALLGELFARAALRACRKFKISPRKVDLIGSHGQTVFHQGRPQPFLGARIASTLQIGEPAVIAARTGVTTIGDFRPSDIAAGGEGAPLVPFVDYLLYRHPRRGRVALNIGGIANLTVISPGARPGEVFAFDTGPGNMVIDALVKRITRGELAFDRDSAIALHGHLLLPLINTLLRDPYFRRKPPKTAGREEFGSAFVERLHRWQRKYRARDADLVRTAAMLTALSIVDAIHSFVLPRTRVDDLIISGGGAHNPLIVAVLMPKKSDSVWRRS